MKQTVRNNHPPVSLYVRPCRPRTDTEVDKTEIHRPFSLTNAPSSYLPVHSQLIQQLNLESNTRTRVSAFNLSK